jgi:hypothetical protein
VNPAGSDPAALDAKPPFPLNRVLALLGPYIAVLAGGIASWASTNFPGLVTDVPKTTAGITQALTFIVGALIAWGLQHKYLTGWQRWEGGMLALQVASSAAARPVRPQAGGRPWAGPDLERRGQVREELPLEDPFASFPPELFDFAPAPLRRQVR